LHPHLVQLHRASESRGRLRRRSHSTSRPKHP
jgi:hypothetical protein